MINHFADVAAFNEACGAYRVEKFGDPLPLDVLKMRRKLVDEEYTELMDAIADNDRIEIADACADLAYVALGWLWALRHNPGEFKYEMIQDPYNVPAWIGRHCKCAMERNDTFALEIITHYALSFGFSSHIPMDDVWREVQRTNMAKIIDGKVLRSANGKIIKPEGWTPPDVRGVLQKAGAL